jgi:hypothetical protein
MAPLPSYIVIKIVLIIASRGFCEYIPGLGVGAGRDERCWRRVKSYLHQFVVGVMCNRDAAKVSSAIV